MLIVDASQLRNRRGDHDAVLDDDDRKPAAAMIRGEYEGLRGVIVVDVEVVVVERALGGIPEQHVGEPAPIGAVYLDVARHRILRTKCRVTPARHARGASLSR